MKYFLPELYVQLNSPDEDLADAAEIAIDRAGEQYDQRWREIRPHLPPTVVQFYEEQNLHDADVFAPAKLSCSLPPCQAGDALLVAQQINTLYPEYKNTLTILHYVITEEPRVEIPVCSNVFNQVQPIWLYDEFDMVGPRAFTHSILISDGRVVTIPFRDFHYYIAKIIEPAVCQTTGVFNEVIPDAPASKP